MQIKKGSSESIHDELGMGDFAWQTGYGAFTVSPRDLQKIKRYIAEQEKHHRRKSFQEEFREFLEQTGIAFDERYLW
ncbi:MAG TPA: transposase [Acidobacteriota bacterium]